MLPEAAGRGQHFQDLGHSFSLYGPPSRQITYIYWMVVLTYDKRWQLRFLTINNLETNNLVLTHKFILFFESDTDGKASDVGRQRSTREREDKSIVNSVIW